MAHNVNRDTAAILTSMAPVEQPPADARAVPRAEQDLRLLESVMTPQPGRPVKAVAYCFCEL